MIRLEAIMDLIPTGTEKVDEKKEAGYEVENVIVSREKDQMGVPKTYFIVYMVKSKG